MSLRRLFSTNLPHDRYTIFLDRDLDSPKFTREIAHLGVNIERSGVRFPDPTTPETIWLPIVGAHGWLAFTRDKKILRIEVERDAAMWAGVPLFILVGELTHPQMAMNLAATWGKIQSFRDRFQPPFIASVHRPDRGEVGVARGKVEMELTERQWRELIEDRRRASGGR